jgi:hypothetical protein
MWNAFCKILCVSEIVCEFLLFAGLLVLAKCFGKAGHFLGVFLRSNGVQFGKSPEIFVCRPRSFDGLKEANESKNDTL